MKPARILSTIAFCALPLFCAKAQMVIGTGTAIAGNSSNGTATVVAVTGNFTNNSSEIDFSNISLVLVGTDQNLNSVAELGGLIIDGGGTKTISGEFRVAKSLTFNNGEVVSSGAGSKFIFSKPDADAGDIVVNNPFSYVNGDFYSVGTGTRFFPIGNNDGYFPSQLSNVNQGSVVVGMRVTNQAANFTHGTELFNLLGNRTWQIIDDGSLEDALLSLSSNETSILDPTAGTVVVASTAFASEATSLSGSLSGEFVIADKGIDKTQRFFTIGQVNTDLVKVVVHNMITPFRDGANDYLEIDNIGIFPVNTVTILDRWGGKKKQWSGYVNQDFLNPDTKFDLSDLATGNYICIVEYKDGSATKKVSQMVTIVNL